MSRIALAAERGLDAQVQHLLGVGRRGLPRAYDEKSNEFAQTLRGVPGPEGVLAWREGTNLRYAAMATLGLNKLTIDEQRDALAGKSAGELIRILSSRAADHDDPGAVALVAWAEAEVNEHFAAGLFARLAEFLDRGEPLPTVDVSWIVTASTVAHQLGDASAVGEKGAHLLLEAQGVLGIFPHVLPADSQSRWRRHVGSFADQVYPIQALARLSKLNGDRRMLDAAEATAQRICDLQGPDGQWWWHYDTRTGDVVEGFPVYSVHQHAMAPMALFDLVDAGGADHTAAIMRGLDWIGSHPEVAEDLVAEVPGVIWRKVGRREPSKAARGLAAMATAVRPGLHVPGVDRLWPAQKVDHECRPYELGWLLYAWLPSKEVTLHDCDA